MTSMHKAMGNQRTCVRNSSAILNHMPGALAVSERRPTLVLVKPKCSTTLGDATGLVAGPWRNT